MPKLHDACQIFAEEMIARLREFSPPEAPYALAMACHAVEEDLLQRHADALTVVAHLWQVLDETIQNNYPELDGLAAVGVSSSALALPGEDDLRILQLSSEAIESARGLFPGGQ